MAIISIYKLGEKNAYTKLIIVLKIDCAFVLNFYFKFFSGEILFLNIFYELTVACTSIIAETPAGKASDVTAHSTLISDVTKTYNST